MTMNDGATTPQKSADSKPVMASVSPPISVRGAEPCDVATIAVFNLKMAFETEKRRLNPTTLERGVQAVFEQPTRGSYFVAEVNGVVVGCLLITHEWSDWRNGDIWWLQSVYVDLEYRRLGVFRAMYAHVESLAREAGAIALRLYVERHNSRARETYRSLGFETTDYDIMHRPL
jgi:GNAT superfamily N-acetyltransferase